MAVQLPSFEELKRLAETDPDAFEQLRRDKIAQFIEESPTDRQMRLKSRQFAIDQMIEKSSNPLHATVLVMEEMHQSLGQLSQALHGEVLPEAKVLDFNAKKEIQEIKKNRQKS